MSPDIPPNKIKCKAPFFIAFIGRSGSTHFHHLLNQHPDIKCYKEMFNPVAFVHKTRQISEKNMKDYITNYDLLKDRIKLEGMEHYLSE